ncbi:endonuclease/exonuclease/phosphatase family protein [Paenibacillus polymyxa]|uniref:endonuclease/exonuclease/phosphatase family protein n=1 Tax=Paenibacillus polymyxa TaxID=1406 RepID=UPI002AB5C004|nr:endonuclease/exonuclease/phosphatase family protein [Paenibacillus polymyxa]MDY7989900.1 endonuclease/exonuclease/phosphatase family protein [Paenibacillus polymyxa]MDY8116740.1 endonuclease/exonuclease/phosphatase family protein [Paenibacillus polymyxa]
MKLRCGTFNLYQFAEPPFCWYEPENVYTDDDWKEKRQWVKDQLTKMNCDVIGFQEVFSVNALEDLTNEAGYKYFRTIESTKTDANNSLVYVSPVVAIASKFPIVKLEQVEIEESIIRTLPIENSFKFSRIPIKATISAEGIGTILVYVVHLKSKRPFLEVNEPNLLSEWDVKVMEAFQSRSMGNVASLLQRGTEAAVLYRDISQNLYRSKEIPVILLGDLNDDENSIPMEALTNRAYINEIDGVPYSELPDTVKKLINSYRLYDSYNLTPNPLGLKRTPTHYYNGVGSVLDYIFVSNHLNLKNNQGIGQIISLEVLDKHLKSDGIGNHKQSDHAQVVATVDFHNG